MTHDRRHALADPDPARDRMAQCDGKVGMRFEHVVIAARRFRRGFYKCPYCRMWHVGTRSIKKRQ